MVDESDEVSVSEFRCLWGGQFPGIAAAGDAERERSGGESTPEAGMKVAAHRVADGFLLGKTESFPELFGFVERHIIFGCPEVRDLLITGFLEELKNYSCMLDLDPVVFEEWLGPESHLAWRWLEKKWHGRTSLAGAAAKSGAQTG